VVVVSGTVVGTVSGVESATSGAMVSTAESITVESLGTEFEPLGVSFSEQPAKTPASAPKQTILRAIFTTPQ
jgi:hypothetical protein